MSTLELCAMLQGELDPRRETALEEHLATCATCAEELAWLRAERRLFAVRARDDRSEVPGLDSVLARAERRPVRGSAPDTPDPEARRVAAWRGAHAALGLCAAAALLALLGPGRSAIPGFAGARSTARASAEPAPIVRPIGSSPDGCATDRPSLPDPLDMPSCFADGESIDTTPAVSRNEIEDEYGACLLATPVAPRHARRIDDVELSCVAPPL